MALGFCFDGGVETVELVSECGVGADRGQGLGTGRV